jgi:hypothetical protein
MDAASLRQALQAAAAAHHDYETVVLGGRRDDWWAGFYAAFLLGRLGEFMTASALTSLLERVEGDDWWEAATAAVLAAVGEG